MVDYQILQTEQFEQWFDGLSDREARSRILVRIRRLSLGNPGDIRSAGKGISEMRIHHGPGYRIYLQRYAGAGYLLLTGGTKKTQKRDIRMARALSQALQENDQ